MSKVPAYYYNQSAVIPVREHDGIIEVLLITSRKKKRWVLPKGVHEPELTAEESAEKEAWEEAGIEGKVSADAIGVYEYKKWKGICTVRVHVMEVEKMHDEWEEQFRDREWVSLEEADKRLNEPELKKIIQQVPNFIAMSKT